jgi:hypothetical protein
MPDSHSKSIAGPLAEILRDSALIWRGSQTAHPKTRPTGFPGLDERLPGGGWPIGNLVEIVPACEGLGELSLCLPLLVALCRDGRRAAFVAPPHIPYAPALQRAGLPWIRSFGLTQPVKRMPAGQRSNSCGMDKPVRCCFGHPSTMRDCCADCNWRLRPAMPSLSCTGRQQHFARPPRPPYVSLFIQTETTLAPSSSKFAADIRAVSPCL